MLSPQYYVVLEGLLELYVLDLYGRTQTEDADLIRDRLYGPYNRLTAVEREMIENLSESLFNVVRKLKERRTMGWATKEERDQLKSKWMALTQEQREALTWDEAKAFVADDTLEQVRFQGDQIRAGEGDKIKPWQAIGRIRGMT